MSEIELKPANNNEVGTVVVDTPEMNALYEKHRESLLARYQELFADKNYIPVVRTASTDNGKTKIRQDRIGEALFSNMHKHNFLGSSYYRCETCRGAFAALFPLWFMDAKGAVISPLVELQMEMGFPAADLRRTSAERVDITWAPLNELSLPMTRAVTEGWTHFSGFTEKQIEDYAALPGYDLQNARNLMTYYKAVAEGIDVSLLRKSIRNIASIDTALGGLEHLKNFVEHLGTFANDDVLARFIAQNLRYPQWRDLSHFAGSTAGKVMGMFVAGRNIEEIVDFYLQAVDPAKYKQRSAEVSANLFVQMRDQLVKTNAMGILARRPAVIGSDVLTTWARRGPIENINEVEVPKANDPLSAVERLIVGARATAASESKVFEARNDSLRSNVKSFEQVLEQNFRHPHFKYTTISLDGFLKMAKEGNFRRIALTNANEASVFISVTTETEDTPGFASVLNDKIIGVSLKEHRSLVGVSTTNAIPRSVLTQLSMFKDCTKHFELAALSLYGEVQFMVPVGASGITDFLYQPAAKMPTLLGSEVRNDVYGMSGAIRTASAEIGLVRDHIDHPEGEFAAGFVFTVGDVLVVEDNAGDALAYRIGSAH